MTYSTQPGQQPGIYQPQKPPRPQRHKALIAIFSVLGGIIVLGGIAGALSSGKPHAPAHSAPPAASSGTTSPAQQAPSPVTRTIPVKPQYAAAQQQALDSARNYLSDGEGFSRAGLIQQLHSPYGDGFSMRLAVFAVDHVRVNWYHQAVISARGYKSDGEGFSCSGLVQQLNSPFGGNFTLAQAHYGAKAVGIC